MLFFADFLAMMLPFDITPLIFFSPLSLYFAAAISPRHFCRGLLPVATTLMLPLFDTRRHTLTLSPLMLSLSPRLPPRHNRDRRCHAYTPCRYAILAAACRYAAAVDYADAAGCHY